MPSDPESPKYAQYLSIEELSELVAPSEDDVRVVTEWLESFGAKAAVLPSRDFIRTEMPVNAAESLLETKLYECVHSSTGQKVVRSGPHYTMPESVADRVDFVGGLVRFPKPRTQSATPRVMESASEGDVPKTTPSLIRKLHSVGAAADIRHPKTTQCVVSFLEQYILRSDLKQFFDEVDPKVKRDVKKVEKWIGPNDETKPGTEASLDIQYLMGVADNVRTWVWNTAGLYEEQEPFLEWLADVSATKNAPLVFSISYQDYEPTVSPEYMDRINVEFQKLGSRGRTIVTGSGDWGAGCNDAGDRFFADFPSSSPYITSLGSTTLTAPPSMDALNKPSYHQEGIGFSSGGFSEHFGRPSYQEDAVQGYLKSPEGGRLQSFYNSTGRAFPDLSTIGVLFQVYVDGEVQDVAGTSASTPTFAAMVSLLNDGRLKDDLGPMGFINPFLYKLAQTHKDAFVDITGGQQTPYKSCKESFKAVAGWDPMTGLGTPVFDVLFDAAVKGKFAPRPAKNNIVV